MHNTTASIIIGILVVALAGGLVYWQKNDTSPAPTSTTNTTENTATTTTDTQLTSLPEVSGITSTEVAAHNSRETCWSTINGNVYDLSSWITEQPGGEQAILQLCGTDGSAKFNGKHGDAPKQAAILIGFKLGVAAP
jgi:cytochrome b involved in lipid metabolism